MPGDIVRNKNSESDEFGLFIGICTFKAERGWVRCTGDYTCAEVLWFERSATTTGFVTTIHPDSIEVVKTFI